MLAENQNVVKLNNSEVYEDIMIYLNSLEKRTKVSYEKNIRQFFKHITKGRDIEFLTEEDLRLKRNHVLAYRSFLKEEGNVNGTINQKIASLKSLYKELQANDYEVNSHIFEVKRLKHNSEQYGEISLEQAEMLAETVFVTEKTKPLTKHLMIKFATRTSFRLDEILRITWNDFEECVESGIVKVTSIGKGQKKRTTSISSKFYNDLLLLKEEAKKYKKRGDSSKLFCISKDAVNDMMHRLIKECGLEGRNIVFHSLRQVAINLEYSQTGDLAKVIAHSGHSSMDTLYKHYMSKNRDFTDTPGVKIDEELNWDFLNELSIEDFKEFFIQNNYKFYNDIKNFSRDQKDQK